VKKADAICRAYKERTPAVTTPKSYREIERYVNDTLPYYEAALRRLEELEPPSSDADAVAAWLAADRRVARAVRELGAAAARRDFPSVTAAASRAQLAGSRSRRAAAGIGLQVCANVGS
jgi:hypothetical protein